MEGKVDIKSAYSKLVDGYKEEGREEGRRQSIAVLIGLYEDGILSKTTLLPRAKDGGILDDVLKQLNAVNNEKISVGEI